MSKTSTLADIVSANSTLIVPTGVRGSGGTITSTGGYTVHTFLTSGNFTA